ncbi:helix-turn-helix domain-containing protein [Massilia horti]|uniref:XRE family transcriptional regulator n=1 Tax=Massilia horti TaxID=2562153 RepID=A0A4Y9T2F2_9BURK|nr:helix-turn-helix transcriptional regulator [Massilia horti]TFW33587.1 XRE family transcriptional regulator [Massilia horti]
MSPAPTQRSEQQADSARSVLAQNVVRLRTEKRWSQEMLAFESGLHRTFIAHVERRARNISIDNLEKIARALGVQPYILLMPLQA